MEAAKRRMEEAVEAMRREFATVRTGKATPTILDTVRVEAYGSRMPLNQLSNVSAPDHTLLVVQPYDPGLLGAIERAIIAANLGFNPSNDGNLVRVPIPPLNEERRREYVRLLHKMAEEGRVSVRHARREANEEIRARMKNHDIGEDEGHRQMDGVQKLTQEYTKTIDEMLARKEKEVMSV